MSEKALITTSADEPKLSHKELNQFLESLPSFEEAIQHQFDRIGHLFPIDLFIRPQGNFTVIFFNLADAVPKPWDYQLWLLKLNIR